ncbi:MAG: Hsp20/alpha crystallin family protein [Clostridia bacterium]|nr:Hsp20/alpha crystallin family protein [Clostridia bacterium]
MMMIPRRRDNFDLFDDLFSDPFFEKRENKLMRTDIKEKGDHYLIDIDLPGYDKDNIKISIDNGYLTISASMDKKVENEKEGKFIHQERYIGECSRSFYVGDTLKESDIKASFKNGTLKITLPKQKQEKIEKEKKYIPIDE